MQYDKRHGDTQEDREIAITKPKPNGCESLRQVVSFSEVGEGAFFVYTDYYLFDGKGAVSFGANQLGGVTRSKRLPKPCC